MKHVPFSACLWAAQFLAPSLHAQVCDPSIPCDTQVPGDFDQDGDVDGDDHVLFEACASGPQVPIGAGCEYVDLDGDGDGDQADFGLWQALITGACDCPPLIKEPPNGQPPGPMITVYPFSGEFYTTAVDLRIKGRGIDFLWARKYRSRIGPDTELGYGWDYSYNIRVQRAGPHVRVFDGNTRADVYRDRGDGTWARHELGHVLQQTGLNTYQLVFPDRGTWNFLPLDGSAAEGKIASMVDRNGNAMTFEYDALGRLAVIHDTLDTPTHNRDITIAYNGDGLISSVTDFIGRQVRYEYYQVGETSGSPGDLKSVSTPQVVGTPTGNDFPLGKTTVYTYSTGFADERLNHNLLTITDPKGQTYLTNTYSPSTDPADPTFDWITRQSLGDHPQEVLDLVAAATGDLYQGSNVPAIEAIFNDRVGNVSHWVYDKFHRLLRARHYTGRADPDLPTTATTNRPQNPLRPDDPEYFEVRYEYNDDARPTAVFHPNGNEEEFVYDETNPDPRSRGNLLHHCMTPGPLGGDQSQICESYEYDPAINFDHNFVTSYTDGNGNSGSFVYDTEGNRTQSTGRIASVVYDWTYNDFGQMLTHTWPDNGSGHRRRDEFTYYDSGPSAGYLHETILDAGARGLFNLTTLYEYDAVGNLMRVVDPRGNDTLHTYNALNQVVRTESRPLTLPAGTVRYETNYYYDANDNLVRVSRQNVDDQGNLDPLNPYLTSISEYDALDNPVRACEESGSFNVPTTPPQLDCNGLPESEFITTEYGYEDNSNLALVRFGEAVEGRQPDNQVQFLYDERDLLFRETWAPGDPDQSTTQYDYDVNADLTITYTGLESPVPRITNSVYDGYGRVISTTDPMGNVARFSYDANGNLTGWVAEGEPFDTTAGSSGNYRLAEAHHVFDEMDRPVVLTRSYFDPATQSPITDGSSNTTFVYSSNSQLLSLTDDNGHTTLFAYDTANRKHVVTDAKENTTTYGYDADSNVTSITEVDKSDLGNPDETFVTTYAYDALDRIIQSTDNLGNVDRQAYDSHGNLTRTVDALGNVARYTYDATNRLIGTERDLTTTGDGTGGVTDTITTSQTWDDSHRLVTETDDNGHATTHVYDALDREATTEFADCTTEHSVYDVHGNEIQTTDANGTTAAYSYDRLNRLVSAGYTPGTGVVSDTTSEIFQYDGLSRMRSAQDNDSVVTFQYDSLRNVLSQNQDGYVTASTYDGVGNKLSCTYPGGRMVNYTYDELNRINTINNPPTTLATYAFIGPDRLERKNYANNTATLYTYDGQGNPSIPNPTGDFGVRQLIGTQHLVVGGPVIDERTYKWDPRYNKIHRVEVTPGQYRTTQDFNYDSAYRLAGSKTTIEQLTRIIVREVDYISDGVGNRIEVLANGVPQVYQRDATLCEPADFQMNQYTDTPLGRHSYDSSGNTLAVSDPTQFGSSSQFDVHDQLVRHTSADGSMAACAYDAFGRRISKTVQSGVLTSTTQYLWGDAPNAHGSFGQVLEERDGAGAMLRSYTYGGGPNDVLHMRAPAGDYYYHQDDLGNVVALTDTLGNVIERYAYGDYGAVAFEDGLGNSISGSQVGNPYLYTGRCYDPETGLYYFRHRYLDPATGRFVSRDPLGIWGDPASAGNPYAYAGNNPWTYVDPMGTARAGKPKEIVVVGSKVKEVVREAGFRSDGEWVQAISDAFSTNMAPGADEPGSIAYYLNIRTKSWSYDCWLCAQCGGTGNDPNCDDACNRCSIVAAVPGGSSGGPMPQTREHILLARQVGVPAMKVRPLHDRVLVEPTAGATGGTQSANRRYLYFAKTASFNPDGTPLRAIVEPMLDDRRYRDLLRSGANGQAIAAGPGPYPTAINPMAFSAGSLRAVRGGMNAASAAGALKTIAGAQTDYSFYEAWPAKWYVPEMDAKSAIRKKTWKKAASSPSVRFMPKPIFMDLTPEPVARKRPGRLKWENITLKRGVTSNMDAWQWRKMVE